MAEDNIPSHTNEVETFPLEPRYHPVNRMVRKIYDFLASAKLAIGLLITILLCCLGGVTLYRGDQATEMIFGTLWFNALLVLLVTNTACCFFGRMWGRKITVISFGMILFHLSFVAMFLAIVFNSLFYFEGLLRLTEGETLSNRDSKSYDVSRHGLLFSYSLLKGETTLLQVHRGFKVDGVDKLIAYDISVAEGRSTKNGTIYINNKFPYKGVEYIRDREGFSLLTIVNDKLGKELFGIFIPLQSIKLNDAIIYTTGSRIKQGTINFPPEKGKDAFFDVQLSYLMDNQPGKDRNGKVRFQVWPVQAVQAGHTGNLPPGGAMGAGAGHAGGNTSAGAMPATGIGHTANPAAAGMPGASGGHTGSGGMMPMGGGVPAGKPLADGTVNISEKLSFGEYQLFVPEVRYWVGMNVLYNPGKPFVLASLLAGLVGIIITTGGRMTKKKR
jgi:hypothetical protein